jgi:hypothetical protein
MLGCLKWVAGVVVFLVILWVASWFYIDDFMVERLNCLIPTVIILGVFFLGRATKRTQQPPTP